MATSSDISGASSSCVCYWDNDAIGDSGSLAVPTIVATAEGETHGIWVVQCVYGDRLCRGCGSWDYSSLRWIATAGVRKRCLRDAMMCLSGAL